MTSSLRVGVNVLWCRPGRVGGAEEYLVRQLRGLAIAAPDIVTRLVVSPGFREAHPDLGEASDVVEGSPLTRHLAGRLIEEVRWLPGQVAGSDVVHHGNATIPPRSPRPTLLTIHDLQHRVYPDYFSFARRRYLEWMVPRSACAATVIAVPSEFVRRSVIEAFEVEPAHVVVVPHGFELAEPTAEDGAALRDRYRLGDRRVLVYPAVTYPHKQHRFLLELMAGPLAGQGFVLVLLGGAGRAEASVSRLIVRYGLESEVIRPGNVPDAHRDGLIALAEAVLFPSDYEGFGAPVLEAMTIGTPVICSDRASLPEVVGEGGTVVPLDPEAWTEALERLPARRSEVVARGRIRAADFSVEASGAALARAYRLAASLG